MCDVWSVLGMSVSVSVCICFCYWLFSPPLDRSLPNQLLLFALEMCSFFSIQILITCISFPLALLVSCWPQSCCGLPKIRSHAMFLSRHYCPGVNELFWCPILWKQYKCFARTQSARVRLHKCKYAWEIHNIAIRSNDLFLLKSIRDRNFDDWNWFWSCQLDKC